MLTVLSFGQADANCAEAVLGRRTRHGSNRILTRGEILAGEGAVGSNRGLLGERREPGIEPLLLVTVHSAYVPDRTPPKHEIGSSGTQWGRYSLFSRYA